MARNKVAAKKPEPRPRNAAATRAAILEAARAAFARAGYGGVGLREIAAEAGVTAMMIGRYFGSKEQLFAEVIADNMARPSILTAENLNAPNSPAVMAQTLVDITKPDEVPLVGFLIMLHSAQNNTAAGINREQIEQNNHRVLTEALAGRDAAQRAAILLALVAGFQMMRQTIGLSALAEAKPKTLVKLLTPLFEHIIQGDQATR